MFLLRLKTKHTDAVQLVEDKFNAVELAHEFVGQHNPVDGCSTKPITHTGTTGRIRIERGSSFGQRTAWIIPQNAGGTWEL